METSFKHADAAKKGGSLIAHSGFFSWFNMVYVFDGGLVQIYCDIDATLARSNLGYFMQTCIQRFGLKKITSDDLTGIRYEDFLQLPEMVTYRQFLGEETFQKEMCWIDLDPDVLRSMLPLKGALDGINKLSKVASSIGYCTGRYTEHPQWVDRNQGMAEATKDWLASQGFINAEHVIFCKDKLVRLAQLAQSGERVILIDDLYRKVITRFSHLPKTDPVKKWVLEHFILVAFGAKEEFHECPLKVFPLPKWSDVDSLVAKLERSP